MYTLDLFLPGRCLLNDTLPEVVVAPCTAAVSPHTTIGYFKAVLACFASVVSKTGCSAQR